jgi:hypothetical protein
MKRGVTRSQLLRTTVLGMGLCLVSVPGLWAQMQPQPQTPPAAPDPTAAQQPATTETPANPADRIYRDETYGFTVNDPGNWQRGKIESVRVPGEARQVWSPDGTTTLTIFVQKVGKAVNPWLLLEQSAKGLQTALNVTIREQEVRDVGGLKAMWLVVDGMGTGAAIDGKGTVPTSQHWVAIPREQGDILVFLLITTQGNYSITDPIFVQMLGTLQVTGTQTAGQQVDPSTLPNGGKPTTTPSNGAQPAAPMAPAAPAAPATPPPAEQAPPPPPPARG